MVNLFNVYELDTWSQDLNIDFTLKDCVFGNIKITKGTDLDWIFLFKIWNWI